MYVIPPLNVTAAMVTSSNIAEPDVSLGEAEYAAATAYAVGARCILAATHKVYESLVASNTGNLPSSNLVGTTPKWLEIGPTNKFRMFDLNRNTSSTRAAPLVVTITPGQRIDRVGLLGLSNASTASVVVSTVADGVVYTNTVGLTSRDVNNWYQYFFSPFHSVNTAIFSNIPPVSGATVTVTVSGTGTVGCGGVVLGMAVNLGPAEYGAEDDVLNFSKVDRDIFGNSNLVVRRNVPKLVPPITAKKSDVPAIRAAREALNAVPALWVGIDDTADAYADSLIIFGIYKRFSLNLAYPEYAVIHLELEEI